VTVKGVAAVVVAFAVSLAAGASASANTYCVPAGGGAGCSNPGALALQSALDAASANPGPDTVKVAAGAFVPVACSSAGFSYSGSGTNSLTLSGAGATTVLTCPADYDNAATIPILTVIGPATVSDLEIRLPSGLHDRGLQLSGGASANDLTAVSDPGAIGAAVPVQMTGGSLTNSLIGDSLSDNGVALIASAGATISDTAVTGGGTGIDAQGSPDTTVTRTRVSARVGVQDEAAGVTISNSAIDILHGAGAGVAAGLRIFRVGFPGSIALTARHVSIAGTEAGSFGVDAEGQGFSQTATVTLTDSVIHGPTNALNRSATPGATANLTTSYDAYPAGSYAGTGSGTTTELTPPITADPGFAAPADPHIDASSPLIDAGTPGGLGPGEPTTDLDGNPRILDGNGDCAARRDIGAYEFVGSDTVHASAATLAVARQLIAFHATGCSVDAALPVTFSWSFDDGAAGAGANVSHAFTRAGVHHATVTIHDSAGRTGSASVAVSVVLPQITHLKLSPARVRVRQPKNKHFKLGTTITYTDTVAGRATFTVMRPAPGARHGKTCGPVPRHSGKHVKRCTRSVVVGTFGHLDVAGANHLRFSGKLRGRALAPGSYVLAAVPAGGAGKPATVAFTVLGG
jgi:hypothetical protein